MPKSNVEAINPAGSPYTRAEQMHADLARAAAILRVVVTALDTKDDVEDESCAVTDAIARIEAAYQALDGAEVHTRASSASRARRKTARGRQGRRLTSCGKAHAMAAPTTRGA